MFLKRLAALAEILAVLAMGKLLKSAEHLRCWVWEYSVL